MFHQPILAATPAPEYRPTCPDCGSTAQGRGFFGKPYCGLCEQSVPVSLTEVHLSADGLSVWA